MIWLLGNFFLIGGLFLYPASSVSPLLCCNGRPPPSGLPPSLPQDWINQHWNFGNRWREIAAGSAIILASGGRWSMALQWASGACSDCPAVISIWDLKLDAFLWTIAIEDLLCPELIWSLKLGNVWVLVQLIFGPCWPTWIIGGKSRILPNFRLPIGSVYVPLFIDPAPIHPTWAWFWLHSLLCSSSSSTHPLSETNLMDARPLD